jgi:hypothetical protein
MNRPAAALTLLLALLTPTLAQSPSQLDKQNKSIDTLIGDHSKVQRLVTDLQQAVAKHDRTAVAALVHYPIKINPGDHPASIRTPQAFIAAYDTIITPAIAAVIQNQKYEDLFVNYQGAMFGDGEVWIMEFCPDKSCKQPEIKIATIQTTTNPKR